MGSDGADEASGPPLTSCRAAPFLTGHGLGVGDPCYIEYIATLSVTVVQHVDTNWEFVGNEDLRPHPLAC